MADERLQREQAHLRAAIDSISDQNLKTHMAKALDSFDASEISEQSGSAANLVQGESNRHDEIISRLLEKEVTVRMSRDALFVAVHALLLEAGYKLLVDSTSDFSLPENWDANSANGLFTAAYVHPNSDSVKFLLQGLFVGRKFEVFISDDNDHTHSIELSIDKFIASVENSAPMSAANVLHDLDGLRKEFIPFAEKIRPLNRKEITSQLNKPASRLGRGDAFPPGIGGGNPDMLVGPDHPLFGHRGNPSVGPVPGARFDPFGPSIDPLGPSGGFRPPSRGPAPTMPFGGPGPDHLRMPRDDDMDPGFSFAGGGHGFSQAFRSNDSFF
ncbi:Fbxo7/PI31 domain [Plasmopara halstedii]|uniref:Fbxo7/PI31 domain n=1 Tax=Plasmopara halstedii TaxID=4781 RepID=A0A0P1ALH8_PLAHL|nr:Fbxo7/PI31 domain [Plasmopara halstedii]CEG42016.1 Fbxo7/PI31 domain [Plasmopara halstedii]|eukprot:XP_024578385.1 Fbxo7/PI31 domain [Plasmopara halstedii]